MTAPSARTMARPLAAEQPRPNGSSPALPAAMQDPKAAPIDYRGLDFKEMLAACPVDGLDLERRPEPPRPVAV